MSEFESRLARKNEESVRKILEEHKGKKMRIIHSSSNGYVLSDTLYPTVPEEDDQSPAECDHNSSP